jgi:type IV secretory pathway VirB4 component
MSRADGSPVLLNYWDLTNPHSTVCATSGGGKTVSMEHELMMEMLTNPKLQAYYIDPQGVLGNFANLVDGTMIDLGSKGKAIINPMDKYVLNGREEELGERLQFLRPLIELMLKCEMTATERSAFTRAIKRLYYHFEDGESILPILERSYVMQTLYAPIHKRLGEVMAKLKEIYDFLREKYQIPTTGRVAGIRGATRPTRPVCHLEGGRWYYKGEGETATALPEMKLKEGEAQPAPVWYPAKEWFNSLAQEFSRLVQEEGVFDGLDRVAKRSAIRDAFIELKLGMPILEDLMPFLAAEEIPHLVSNLEPYYDRAVYGDLFNGYTNVALDKRFVGFNVRDLDDPILKSIRIFQVINFTWGMVRGRRIPGKAVIPCRFIVDEFGVLLETFPDVVNYVSTLFKRGRYFGLAMTIIVQNLSSLLDYPAAKECVENSSRILLLKQEKTALHRIQSHFGLTNSQVEALLNARPGDALQKVNEQWVQFKYTVPKEHLAAYDTRPKQAEEI